MFLSYSGGRDWLVYRKHKIGTINKIISKHVYMKYLPRQQINLTSIKKNEQTEDEDVKIKNMKEKKKNMERRGEHYKLNKEKECKNIEKEEKIIVSRKRSCSMS